MEIKIESKGNFENTKKFLNKLLSIGKSNIFDECGEKGVLALEKATPVRSGLTASSWSYAVEHHLTYTIVKWYNTNVVNGVSVAIILDKGHGTRNGGYVKGLNYIDPALEPVFDEIKNKLWQEVTKS